MSRLRDAKVHLGNHFQRFRPRIRLVDLRGVFGDEALVDFWRGALDSEQEEAEEIEEREAGEDANVGARARHVLDAEAGVVAAQGAGEEAVAVVGGPDVAHEQVGQDGAPCKVRREVGVAFFVPSILHLE